MPKREELCADVFYVRQQQHLIIPVVFITSPAHEYRNKKMEEV